MKWHDKPDGPGYYWVHQARGVKVVARVRLVAPVGLLVDDFGAAGSLSPSTGRWQDAKWFGPLTPPAADAGAPVPVPVTVPIIRRRMV